MRSYRRPEDRPRIISEEEKELIRKHLKAPKIDALITSEEELHERLRALDEIGTEEARKLQTILKIIWEKRKKIAKGRKIRRVGDLVANIHEKTRERRTEIQKLRGEMIEYVKGFWEGK